jgi:hypothetical protein
MWIEVATYAGASLTLVGIAVGVYTLTRVQRVARAQAAERRVTQELIGVDELELDLRRVIMKLHEYSDQEAVTLATELSVKLGAIQGVRRAWDGPAASTSRSQFSLKQGFFGEEFVLAEIGHAHSAIDIITGRTLLVSSFYVMERIRQACERGVQVRVIGLSEDADESIIADALRTVSNPAPIDADDYRKQIVQNKEDIMKTVATWRSDSVRACFCYRMDASVPRASLLRRDNTVNIGFLQFYRAAQPNEISQRDYIQVMANSGIGEVAMKHFDIAWNEGKQILPPPEAPSDCEP